jgi:hypothetical protein
MPNNAIPLNHVATQQTKGFQGGISRIEDRGRHILSMEQMNAAIDIPEIQNISHKIAMFYPNILQSSTESHVAHALSF